MRVAFIGQKGIPAKSGGVERHAEEIASRLVNMGVDVTVYCRSTYMKESCENYKGIRLKTIKTLDSKSLDAIVYCLKATLDAVKQGYDIIHYHAIGPASLVFIPHILKKKTVVTIHGLDWERRKWGWFARGYLKLGERMAGKLGDAIISVSLSLADYFISKYKRPKERIVFIPNGVEVPESLKADEITKLGLQKDSYILFLARLVPEKGAHYLIDAYKGLNTGIKLVIAGGPSYTKDYENSIKSMAQGHKNIIFTGTVGGALMAELYSNCLLYVLPSDIEGMPITLLEALSYGKCCIASDIPENRYVLKDGEYGFLFRRGDREDLRDKLSLIMQNPELAYQKASAARAYAKKEFNWDRIARDTLDVYRCLAPEGDG